MISVRGAICGVATVGLVAGSLYVSGVGRDIYNWAMSKPETAQPQDEGQKIPAEKPLPPKLLEALQSIDATYTKMDTMRDTTNAQIDRIFDVLEPDDQYAKLKKEVESDARKYKKEFDEFADPKSDNGVVKEARKKLGLDD